MKLSVGWLRELVELRDDAPEAILAELVRVGLEEESVIEPAIRGPLVVGRILEAQAEEHSNGKTVRWCQVRVAPEGETAADGGADVRGIVCGAPNAETGALVVVALPGAVLPGDFRIAARKTYGHVSDGMIASERELGLGTEHGGILRLDEQGSDASPGQDALALLGLGESGFEVNVTPDRGYAFSARGIAREYAHATGRPFADPAARVVPATASGYPLSVADEAPIRGRAGVRRFVVRVVEDVDASRPTPAWMAARLRVSGVRSISLVVDITNYVMLELGNPVHAYDLDRLDGPLGVRRARTGERVRTLDDQDRELDGEDLVIVDDSGPIGLAGVMGGASTEVGATTRRVLVEAACFDSVSVARTARRHKLPSEAARRFERGVDPELAPVAAQRVVDLLAELAGGRPVDLGADTGAEPGRAPIDLPVGFAQAVVGVEYAEREVRDALETVGCTVDERADGYAVTPPSWRPDLADRTDLVEEVARLAGYDRIPTVLPVAPPGRGLTRSQRGRRRLSDALAAAGLTEVLTYPFLPSASNGVLEEPGLPEVVLENALDGRASSMRRLVLPGLLEAAHRNVSRGATDLAIFELGRVFRPAAGAPLGTETVPPGGARPSADVLADLEASVPHQPFHLAVVVAGSAVVKRPGAVERRADWRDALVAAEQIGAALGVQIVARQGARPGMHPGRTAELVVGAPGGVERVVGFAGELHPDVAAQADLVGRVAVLEVDVDALVDAAPATRLAHELRTMPAATQDLTLVVRAEVPVADVLDAVVEGAGELLEDAALLDDYRGQGVPEGARALTFSLRFRAADRTLTSAEASEAKLAGAALAGERFGATVRQ